MPKDKSPASPEGSRVANHRRQLYVVPVALVVASIVIAGVVVSLGDDRPSTPPSTGPLVDSGTTTTATTISTRTEITTRLREILGVRDRALLARDAELLSSIYTIDCECLEDGRELIEQLRRENIVWRNVATEIAIQSAEEVNSRLWVVVASVRTPSVRIETEAGELVRIVPPERNLVRFALAKPLNEEEWLLGHASTFR
jgi:hypothetical protein